MSGIFESILFKDVQMVLPEGIRQGDLLVEHGKITQIEPNIHFPAQLVIHEKGLTLLPGVIDPHVHFRDPGAPHKETIASGSRAAVAGGVTSFLDMPNTTPSATTREAIAQKKAIAAETSLANYGFFIGATPDNLEELQRVEQVPGIKIFMGSSTGSLLVDRPDDLERIFRDTPHLIAVHAEDEAMVLANKKQYEGSQDVWDHTKIRSPEAALKATEFAVALAKKYQKRLHICHLTTEQEAFFLAQNKPKCVSTEVSPQHLLLFGEGMYRRLGTLAQINPPLRDERHAKILWMALQTGVIDCIATDHAPHTLEEKAQPFGKAHSGMPGVETSLSLILTLMNKGKCHLEDVVKWMSAKPAELYGIVGKGQLKVGYDADLTLVDLKAKRKLTNASQYTKVGWTAFEGWEVQGLPIATFVNGNQVFREGDFFTEVKGTALSFLRS